MIIVCSSDRLLHVLEPLLCSVSHSGDRRQPRLRGELVLRAWYMVLRAAYQGVLRVSLWVGGSTSELSGISRAVLEHLFSLLIKPTHRTTTCAHVLSTITTTSRWRNAADYSASRSAELPASRSASPSDQLLLAASVHLLSATVPHSGLRGVARTRPL